MRHSSATRANAHESFVQMERTIDASLERVWSLWTTPAGMESWWGPIGFDVTVRSMDVRAGGCVHYFMTARDPDIVAFMERSGMATATDALITYHEVLPTKRLRYAHLVDFVPEIEPYEVATQVELTSNGKGTRMNLRFDRHHDATWTERAKMGWESQLEKLVTLTGDGASI